MNSCRYTYELFLSVASVDYDKIPSMNIDESSMDRLTEAARLLKPTPRDRQWVSISFCVMDAVFSIQSRYGAVVAAVGRTASALGVESPSVRYSDKKGSDPVPLEVFTERFESGEALATVARNRQRTSTRGGVLKADAVLQYAKILLDHRIHTLQDARGLLADQTRLAEVETALRKVPGEGKHGVRRGYLWMLVGADDLVKPDRMVLRWLQSHGVDASPDEVRRILLTVADRLTVSEGRPVTAWEVDHAVWLAARGSN